MHKFEYLKALPPAPVLSHADKVLLLAVLNHTDQHGRNAFPKASTLAEETGIHRHDVTKRLNELERRGYLIGEHRPHRPTVWALSLPGD